MHILLIPTVLNCDTAKYGF
uniref:Uncharacterized protein n=1 Tax=Anguilla anguilla TaxID=7936 RepID=A0A0E9PD07_ANGAN